jgi:hypothetical protein
MSCRLFAPLLLVILLPLASAQEGKKDPETKKEPAKYEDVLQSLVDTMGKITKTLALVVDEETAKANKPALRTQAAEFIEARKKSRELAPPVGDAKEKLAQKFRPEIEKSRKELTAQVARVQRVPGGNLALQEIRAVFDKKAE